MIHSVEIKGLRGIKEGRLTDLTPLVILVGPNGCGKSTILDAILIGASPSPGEGIGQAVTRKEGLNRAGIWLFWRAGSCGPAEITVDTSSKEMRSCKLTLLSSSEDRANVECTIIDQPGGQKQDVVVGFDENNLFQAGGLYKPFNDVPDVRLIDPYARHLKRPLHELYTKVVRQGGRQEVRNILGSLVPDMEELQILTEGDQPIVYFVYRDHGLPATLAGDGIRLLLSLTLELATRQGGIVLLEEPEVNMHPGALRQVARAILATVRRGVQIVLSTHSLELIDALVSQCTEQDLNLLSLYRLQLKDGILNSSRLAGPDVAFARSQIEDDLR